MSLYKVKSENHNETLRVAKPMCSFLNYYIAKSKNSGINLRIRKKLQIKNYFVSLMFSVDPDYFL